MERSSPSSRCSERVWGWWKGSYGSSHPRGSAISASTATTIPWSRSTTTSRCRAMRASGTSSCSTLCSPPGGAQWRLSHPSSEPAHAASASSASLPHRQGSSACGTRTRMCRSTPPRWTGNSTPRATSSLAWVMPEIDSSERDKGENALSGQHPPQPNHSRGQSRCCRAASITHC